MALDFSTNFPTNLRVEYGIGPNLGQTTPETVQLTSLPLHHLGDLTPRSQPFYRLWDFPIENLADFVWSARRIVLISNIIVEQQISNLKLGAKNWLFAASAAGAKTVAVQTNSREAPN